MTIAVSSLHCKYFLLKSFLPNTISCSGQTISNSTAVTNSTTNVMLTGLEEGFNYTITVTAVNILGESDPMEIVQDTNPISNIAHTYY